MEIENFAYGKRELCSTGVYKDREHWCMGPTHILLRLLSFFASLAAAIITFLSKETATVPAALFPRFFPVPDILPAHYDYSSAFIYFAMANMVACAYTSIALIAGSVMKAAGSKRFMLALSILDLIMVALVGTGSGAATAIGLVGLKGNSGYLRWNRVCYLLGRFCTQVTVAIGASMLGILAFLFLVIASILAFYKRCI